MVIVSFPKIVYPLKYPSNACLSYLASYVTKGPPRCDVFHDIASYISEMLRWR